MMSKLLIVEDDNSINQLLTDLLSVEYQVEQAYSGTEALRLVKEQAYDLILLDLMLPGMSGETFIETVRQFSQVPIIVVTAKAEMSVLDHVFKLGANDYIAKPFHNIEVKARVAAQLNHGTYDQKSEIEAAGVKMDLTQHDGQPLDLKVKEFEILKLFIEYPDKVFTKANLYETMWQEQYFGDDNTLSVHMSRLRAKIAEHTDREVIKTVWGVGFKLNK